MITVSARKANQEFSKLLDRAAKGEEVVITRRGVPVARLAPFGRKPMTPERAAAIKRMVALMEEGFPMGIAGKVTRDDMHER